MKTKKTIKQIRADYAKKVEKWSTMTKKEFFQSLSKTDLNRWMRWVGSLPPDRATLGWIRFQGQHSVTSNGGKLLPSQVLAEVRKYVS